MRVRETVDVRVIPVEAGGLISRNADAVFEGSVAWVDRGFQDVILMADGRDGQAVEMKIGGEGSHFAALARIVCWIGRGCCGTVMVRGCWLCGLRRHGQFVFQAQNQQIARIQSEGGRKAAVGGDVAVTHLAVWAGPVAQG